MKMIELVQSFQRLMEYYSFYVDFFFFLILSIRDITIDQWFDQSIFIYCLITFRAIIMSHSLPNKIHLERINESLYRTRYFHLIFNKFLNLF